MSLDDLVGSSPDRPGNPGAALALPADWIGSLLAEPVDSEAARLPAASSGGFCAVCAAPSAPSSVEPVPVRPSSDIRRWPERLPPVQLCDEHWSQYRSDWLLLGWCVDHYGEALRYCSVHEREIEPL